MIDESSNGATGCIDNHVLVEIHQIVALYMLERIIKIVERNTTHFVILVDGPHASLALILRDDLTSIFHNDLI